ncbi:hypothetical protein [Anaeroselena agilis]|uniref:Uncharacterized protein n=1 Tax=Anaeroselena agilis TaxID=3063788 RepID=A0ABU3P1C3_9FIRM|nr:hypothetical protein [Selenomonadales bacterium 4137-cl]
MSTKLCKPVLKQLVQEIDKAVFRAESSMGAVLKALTEELPEVAVSEEEWNKLDEQAQAATIQKAKKALLTIG